MRITFRKNQMLPTFDYKITILNKIKSVDNSNNGDIWKKTVVNNCSFSKSNQVDNAGNTISSAALFVIRIPKSKNYLEYKEWIKSPNNNFTLNGGDYIIKGEIPENPTTSKDVTDIYNSYRETACKITFTKDNTNTIECMEHYRVEGI